MVDIRSPKIGISVQLSHTCDVNFLIFIDTVPKVCLI